MARSTFNVREEYVGTGALNVYTFDFKIASLAHLMIIQTTDLLVETFRVLGDDVINLTSVDFDPIDGGGTVTLVANVPNNHHLFILMANDEPLQESEFKNKADFTLKRFEDALDVVAGAVQRLAYLMKRAPKVPESVLDVENFDGELASPLIPNYIIAVNAAGTGYELVPNPDLIAFEVVGSVPNDEGGSTTGNKLTLQPADATHPGVLTAIVQTIGGAKTFINSIFRSAASAITAHAGGGQAAATVLSKDINEVTTVASSGDSVKLPTGLAGAECVIINSGVNALAIYPFLGEQIDALGVDQPYVLTTSVKVVRMICASNGAWVAGAATVSGGTVSVTGSRGTPIDIDPLVGLPFIGSSMDNTWYISGLGGPIVMGVVNQIASGTIIGQKLRTILPPGANEITWHDADNLSIDGPLITGPQSVVDWEWTGTEWFEISRRTS